MNDFLIALISGILLLLTCWGAWRFLNSISPCEDDD